MTYVGGSLLRQEALGSPPYSFLAIVLALALLSFASSVQQWLRSRKNGERPPSARWFWYASLMVAGPLILAVAQAASYYSVLPTREAAWPWFSARYGELASEWESLAWATTELCAVCLVTAVASLAVGRCARAVGLRGPFDGYWLANPVSVTAALLLFAAVEPAVRTDFEHWGSATWLTRVFSVVPLCAWFFHAGAGGAAEQEDEADER
jgi:hypothetical protein